MGRRPNQICARLRSIRLNEKGGYVMALKIVNGPQSLIDRTISVHLTAEHIDAISDWEVPNVKNNDQSRLEL